MMKSSVEAALTGCGALNIVSPPQLNPDDDDDDDYCGGGSDDGDDGDGGGDTVLFLTIHHL